MKFANIGDSEPRWKWFRFPGTDLEVELKCVPGSQLAKVQARCGMAQDRPKIDAYYTHVAKHWFRDARGACDAHGQPLDCSSEQIRAAMLADNLEFAAWVSETLQNSSAWLDEGNGDSGSAS